MTMTMSSTSSEDGRDVGPGDKFPAVGLESDSIGNEAGGERGPTNEVSKKLRGLSLDDDLDVVKSTKKKKKKSKRKKKGGGKSGHGELDAWAIPEDEFNSMCSQWLQETSEQVDGLSQMQLQTPSSGFRGYLFEGDLRPWHVTKQMTAEDGIVRPDYSETGDPVSERALKLNRSLGIPVHSPEDIEIMREVGKISRYVLDVAARFLKAGVTGDEIDRVVFKACMSKGVYPSPLNYFNFPKSVCVSVNEVICHGIPDCRPIQEGDVVNLDITVFKHGFHVDLNETYMIGKCDEVAEKLVRAAYESLAATQDLLCPGSLYREIGRSVTSVANKAGFQVTKAYQGHGVGRCFHQLPNVPHTSKNKAVGIMRPGHIFTIEPMINEKTWIDKLWPDQWTAVTRDGKRSAQYEHTFLITEEGFEILTARPGTSRTQMMPFDPEKFRR